MIKEYIPPVTTCDKFGTVELDGLSRISPENFKSLPIMVPEVLQTFRDCSQEDPPHVHTIKFVCLTRWDTPFKNTWPCKWKFPEDY